MISYNFTFQMHEYFYILYSNNDRPSVQQHRYYNCYIFKDEPQTNGFSNQYKEFSLILAYLYTLYTI